MKFITSFLVFLLIGCVRTDVKDVVDPYYKNNFIVTKMIVKGTNVSLMDEARVIAALKKIANKYDIIIVDGTEIFPLNYDNRPEVLKIARSNSADVVLLFSLNKNETSMYRGGYANSSMGYNTVTTFFTPRYSKRRTMDIAMTMIDAKNGKTIWKADGSSLGDSDDGVEFSDLIYDAAKKIFDSLEAKGLVNKQYYSSI